MQNIILQIQHFFLVADKLLENWCKPNPKYIKKESFQGIILKRNKGIVVIYTALFLLFAFDIALNPDSVGENMLNCFCAILAIGSLILSCRYHPQIFNCFFSALNMAYGPCAIISGRQGVYTAYIFVLITPIYVQLVTRDFKHFLFQGIVQNIYLNTIYKQALEEALAYNPTHLVIKELRYSSNLAMLFQAIFVLLIESYFQHAYEQALVYEQKKNQAENQKVFLLGFSHELRNLINSLTGNVKLATFENLSGRAKDLLRNAEVCGDLLLHLINNILDTSKAEIGELEINPVPTQTYDTFERIWGICSELIKRKDLKGHMKIPKDLPRTLMIDHHRLTQIFLNLLGNAIKFTEKGSIDITLSWISNKEVIDEKCFQPYPFNNSDDQDEGLFEKEEDFSLLSDNLLILRPGQGINKNILKSPIQNSHGIMKISVKDTGCGMNSDQLTRLFQKFTQVTLDESKKKLGTGLGLFITKQLCHKMQGEVKVFSQKERGTSFVFCLPVESLRETEEDFGNLQVISDFLKTKNLKTMIVDDAPSNHTILKAFFEKLNVEVIDIALTGLEAYQKYSLRCNRMSKCYPHIIAMDLDMPIMNGKDAAQKIREFECQKQISSCLLLMVSGNCDESEINECLDKKGKIRANAFLRKPIKFEDLASVIVTYFTSS